ncbi:MAG: hypothetical protein MR546_01495 [Oscillospiraceae bacterium]|nr:hypothetical protein [Oscillospiraceae bacterium]
MNEETLQQNTDISAYEKILEDRIVSLEAESAMKVMKLRVDAVGCVLKLKKEIGEYARSVLGQGKPLDLGTIYEIQEMVTDTADKIEKLTL